MKLVILDRDGVINTDSDDFIKAPDEWRPIPGSLEAIARLNQAGYQVVLATNQSGVGRGLFEVSTLNAIHDKMHRALAPDRRAHRCDVLLPARAGRELHVPQAQGRDCSKRSRAASMSI